MLHSIDNIRGQSHAMSKQLALPMAAALVLMNCVRILVIFGLKSIHLFKGGGCLGTSEGHDV